MRQPISAKSAQQIDITCRESGQTFAVDIYKPKLSYRGTILFVHGMSLAGKDDLRVVHFARVLQNLGYLVILPEYPKIKATSISMQSIDNVALTISYFAQSPEYAPNQKIALIAPSFSAYTVFSAIVNKNISKYVSCFLSIGGLANMESVVHFLLTNQKADTYAVLVILKNFYHHITGIQPEIEKAFSIAVEDSWHKKNPGDLPTYLETIKPQNRKIVLRLINDDHFRKKNVQMILEKEKKIAQKSDFVQNLANVECPVFLLHGKHDMVISPQQSILIHKSLREYKKAAKLVITPFLSHGDTAFQLKKIPDIVRLINGFAFFFAHIQPETH